VLEEMKTHQPASNPFAFLLVGHSRFTSRRQYKFILIQDHHPISQWQKQAQSFVNQTLFSRALLLETQWMSEMGRAEVGLKLN